MTKGIVSVDYDYQDTHFTRETFVSYPDQAVVMHVTSDKELNFNAELHTYHNQEVYYKYEKINDKEIKLNAAVCNGNKNGSSTSNVNVIQFEARMILDGKGTFIVSDDNKPITVNGGKEASVYVIGASNYVDYMSVDNSKQSKFCDEYSQNIKSKSYDDIKARHIADFQPLFNSTSLSIDNAAGVDYSSSPTEERVRKDINGKSGFTVGSGSKLDTAHKNGMYYLYTSNKEYLEEIYPYMTGAAEFFTQFLVTDQKNGYLVTAASCSPEQGGIQPGAAMDTQLVRNLYDMVCQASNVLNKNDENAHLLAKISEQMPSEYLADEKGKIAPSLIDKNGLIMSGSEAM